MASNGKHVHLKQPRGCHFQDIKRPALHFVTLAACRATNLVIGNYVKWIMFKVDLWLAYTTIRITTAQA